MFEAKIVQINAEKKTIPILTIQVHIKNSNNYPIQILGYKLDVRFAGITVGTAFNYYSIPMDNGGNHYFNEEIQVTPYLFEAIDKARRGGDIHADGYVNFLYLNESDQAKRIPIVCNSHFDSYKLSQMDWINLASKLGYTRYKLFEMLWPDIPQLPELNNIVQELQDAQILFYEGKNNEVVSKCRLLLEELAPIVASKTPNTKFKMNDGIAHIVDSGSFLDDKEAKSDKIESLRQSIWNYHHIGPHYKYAVTREDAELSIMLCLSIVRYYSVQLNKLAESAK